MYFWNIDALKDEIKRGDFGDEKAIAYIVISLILYSILFELVYLFPVTEERNTWDYVESVLSIVVPMMGILYAYQKNGGAKGKDFANKYFSIGFVVGVRFMVYSTGLMIVLFFYWNYVFSEDEEIPTTFVEVALYSIWYTVFYYRIAKHVEDTI